MQVAIVGAGIAGLTLAVALKRAGISFVVYESSPRIKPVGAGIALANNAMQVYRHLGIADELNGKGTRISTVLLTDLNLQVLDQTSLVNFEEKYQLVNIAIHRSALHRVLLDTIGSEDIQLNKRLQQITQTTDGDYQLEFADGTRVNHPFIIGADGLRSQVRQLLFGDYALRDAHQVCWRGILPFDLPQKYEHVAVESWGKGKRMGFVKLADHQVYWYFLVDEDLHQPQHEVTSYVDECPLWVQQMIQQTPKEKIHFDKIYDLKPFEGWYKEKACLIGDAAHATTPNLGQGACQAIEDVYVISRLLEQYSLEEALKHFPLARQAKAHSIVRESWTLGKIAQWRNPLLVACRNTSFRLLPTWMKKRQMEKMFELNQI